MRTFRFDPALLPSARGFYQRELGELTRPDHKGWARPKTGCPFHDSNSKTSFRVNLDSGGFLCFSCGAKGGDLIDYVRFRDRSDFKAACQTLGVWRGEMTPAERFEIERRKQECQWQRQYEAEREANDRRERLQLRDELHTTIRLYRRIDSELHETGPQAEEHWSRLKTRHSCKHLSAVLVPIPQTSPQTIRNSARK
jgi:hypothetical protein